MSYELLMNRIIDELSLEEISAETKAEYLALDCYSCDICVGLNCPRWKENSHTLFLVCGKERHYDKEKGFTTALICPKHVEYFMSRQRQMRENAAASGKK